jgi:hypothetical protein
MLSVITSDDAEPTIIQRNSDLTRLIEFGTVEAQNHFWEMLMGMASGSVDPRHPIGPKTAELEMLNNRIDELERDIEAHGRQLEDLENSDPENDVVTHGDLGESVRYIVDGMDLAERLGVHTDDDVHDLISTYLLDDLSGTLKRKVVEIVADKLRF